MKKMRRVDTVVRSWMKDKKFKAAYDALEPEYALAGAMIEARAKSGLSQAQLAKKMKTTQPAIARMEGGRQLPSAATLLKLAKATGTKLKIQFVEA